MYFIDDLIKEKLLIKGTNIHRGTCQTLSTLVLDSRDQHEKVATEFYAP